MNRKQYCLMVVLTLVAGLAGGVVSSQFLIGEPVFAQKMPQHQKVVEAEEFRLVDKDGNTRTALRVVTGAPMLLMISKDDKVALQIGLNPVNEWPLLVLRDKNERDRATLCLNANGKPSLYLLDENRKVRVTLGSTPLKVPGTGPITKRSVSTLVLFDEEGNVIWSAP